MPRTRKTEVRGAAKDARARDAKRTGTAAPRSKVVDKIDRLAQRPFLEGDYTPGAGRPSGTIQDDCDTGSRRRRR